MSFTQVYRFQDLNGYESVISKANSDMHFMGFGRILLNAGQTYEYEVTGEEHALVLQSGDFTAWVEYNGEVVLDGVKGTRTNVYDDLPTALYIPPKAKVKLYSENGMEARVFTAWCEEGNTPYFCPPENVEEGEPGEYIYKRKYRFIFGQPGKHNDSITKKLIVGESVSVPGGWIGFPAHRHDYWTEKECVLDEIFSFQVTSGSPDGKGGLYQHGYDLDENGKKIWDEVNVIEESNTAIALPSGFHTTVAMAGSVVYLLWGLAGKDEKVYRVQFDERYSWLEGCLY
ncbi:MAG: 5-deoxy-glucuronate isomerase [Eubacteriales bacterium]|nr:5-deoxy-glucuronate isomerase [Eubacteriales bacterium]